VHFYKIFRASILRILAVLLMVAVLLPAPAFSLDSEDSQIFISGFNSYQKREYKAAVDSLTTLLKKYPDTPLKDMAIFWLARAHYKAGNQQEAGKYMAQFFRDYPDSPLKGTVEEGLVALAEKYQKGEPITSAGKSAAKSAAPQAPAAEQPAAEKASEEKVAEEKVAEERAAEEKAAEEKAAEEKPAAEKAAAEKAAAEKAAAEKAAAEKAAAEKAAAEKAAAEKAAAEKAVAEKAAAEKAVAEKAAAEKAAAEKAAAEKAAAEKAAAEKAAAEKAAAEKAAAEKAAAEKAAAEKAAAEKAAAEKAAAEKAAAEKAAAEKAAAEKAAAESAQQQRAAQAKKTTQSNPLREKAIAAYKAVIDKYPGTVSASSASAKLHQLGIEYPPVSRTATTARQEEVTQTFNLEVAQFADLKVEAYPAPTTAEAGKTFRIPVDITNAGNGSDSFSLDSGFPPEFKFHFAAASTPDVPINTTPELQVGEKFRAVAVGTIPRSNIDGQKNRYPIKIASAFASEVSQTREIVLVSAAPLLRAVVKSDKPKLLPGEKISYRISVLNIGSAPARGVTMRVTYPPQYEPAGLSDGMKQESKGTILLDSLQLKSGESRDFALTFQLKDEALADQELFVRTDLINNDLDKKESFVSATTVVQRVSGVTARATADKLVVIPGQVISIPLIVTNTGNVREVFAIRSSVPGNATYAFFDDVNRDGKRQSNEPIINHVGPLSPREEAYVVLEVATPASASDGAVAPLSVYFEPENAADRSAAVNLQLTYSRPVVELAMSGRGGRLKPGEVSSLELDCFNRGSNLAKQVVLQSILPAQLELVASDPAYAGGDNGVYTWRFDELGAGERRNIKMTYRVKPGIAVGTNMQLKNLLNYQDQLGNRY
jgi:uncharacterized repeat protein (TIGR01451 family)